jgi:diguanylate cyclase (GGDEF)-like protein
MDNRERSILLVDDVELNLDILESIFEENYQIFKAMNGYRALEILKDEKIDLVILDVIMPEMSGFEVLETMKSDPALMDIPVIIATADEGENEEKALVLGADDFIKKPYSFVSVQKRVENILIKHVLERERLKDALEKTERDFRSLSSSVPGGICVWRYSEHLEVTYYNDGLCDIIGCTRQEFAEKFADDLVQLIYKEDRKRVLESFYDKSKVGDQITLIYRIYHTQGIRWVKMSNICYMIEGGITVCRAVFIDVTDEKNNEFLIEKQNKELKHRLEYDPLTEIYNRYGFCNHVARDIQLDIEQDYVIIMMDIERFKVINELYGVEEGDRILCFLADFLQEHCYPKGIIGRLEADHFAIFVPNKEKMIMELINTIQDKANHINNIRQEIKLYFGIYPIEDRDMPVEIMCDRANLALAEVKGKYSENYMFYNDKLNERVLLEQEMTNEMYDALEQEQFQVYYQPIFSLDTEKPVSAEALIRWIHPKKGMISPGAFIPFFEKNGFVVKVDEFLRRKVIEMLAGRQEQGKSLIPISVNLCRLEFYVPDFCDSIYQMVTDAHVSPKYLRLEITEGALQNHPKQLLDSMKVLRDYGFKILMDDFGSEYSSLNMLQEVPVDILKLDMIFLRGNDEYGRKNDIIASTISMAHKIGMKTVAEGIEEPEQAEFLNNLGCNYGQGFYYAKPMPEKEFQELLDQYN